MALDKNVLDRLNANAQLVYDETKASANTHTRVGQAFLDTHELFTEVQSDETDIAQLQKDLESTQSDLSDLAKKEESDIKAVNDSIESNISNVNKSITSLKEQEESDIKAVNDSIDDLATDVSAIIPRKILPLYCIMPGEVTIKTAGILTDGVAVWCSANGAFAWNAKNGSFFTSDYYDSWGAYGIYPDGNMYHSELSEGANAEVWYYVETEGAFYYWNGSAMEKITSIEFATQSDLAKKQDTLTAGDSIKIENNVVSIDPTTGFFQNLVKAEVDTFILAGGGSADNIVALIQSAGLGNLYVKLVNSSEGESVVTINGSSLTIGAGQTYEGYVDSFTALTRPHNLKSVVVVGDASVVFGDATNENYTLESIEMYRTSAWSGTMANFARSHYALKSARVAGGKTTSLSASFYNCTALTSVDLTGLDTSACTTLANMFYNCSALVSVDLSGFDTSACTSLQYMFYNCSALVSVDLSGFNTSQVTTMQAMFDACNALTSVGDLSGWDVSKVGSTNMMFRYCYALESIGDVSGWNLAVCTTLSQMFFDCNVLSDLDTSKWVCGENTSLNQTFCNCNALTAIDVSAMDTSKVTGFNQTFRNESTALLESIAFGAGWDFAEATTVDRFFGSAGTNPLLTTLTGEVKNIKLDFLANKPFTRESALILINGLYDFASEGEEGGTLTLSSATKALLTNDDIAIATNKGWTIA